MRFPPVLVFDCGASRVSASAFTATTDGVPVLERIFLEPLEYDSADDQQWVRAVGDAIRRISTVARLRGRRIALTVPGHLTLTKYIKVPHVDEAKRERIIQFEARQNIPYALEEVVWDYQIVHDDGIDFEVALCAVKLEIIEALLLQCRDIGFEPEVIEPSCMSQVNAFSFCYGDVRESALLINIGARSSNLVFVREDRYFIRNITLAGGAMTQAMADELGCGLTQAERLKLALVTGTFPGEDAPPEAGPALEHARQAFATRLALEVTRSVANYRRQSNVEPPGRVLLTGCGAQLPGLAELLADRLKMPVAEYDPLRGVPFGSGAVEGEIRAGAHQVGEAIGSALRLYQRGLAQFSLLPESVLRARAFRRREPFLITAAALVAATLAIPIMVLWVTRESYRERARTLDTQAIPLRSLDRRIQQARAETAKIRHQIDGIKGLVETKSNWISFFRDLQERLVKIEDVWLDGLEVLRSQGPVAGIGTRFFGQEIRPPAPRGETASLRLHLQGRLLDKNNPLSRVSFESQQRVKTLLSSFTESQFIVRLENERFDNSQPGVLKFDFTLVVNPERPL